MCVRGEALPMSPAPSKVSPQFRGVLNGATSGLVIKPLLHSYLLDAKFPKHFTVTFRQHDLDRGPDGWFHPSTHPLWTERQLWYWVHKPETFIAEQREYMGVLSITMGSAVHDFQETCLKDMGVLLTPEEPCPCGDPECSEWYVEDLELKSRGHMDGKSALHVPAFPLLTQQVYEFKTITERAKLPPKDNDLDWLIAKRPGYYAQLQEYMRMSGLRLAIILFMAMGHPWEMREIHVPFNDKFSFDLVQKYRRVREASPDHLPPTCCGPGSKDSKACMFRGTCPVALETFNG